MNDQQLVRKLTMAILIKLVLLGGLWWAFVHGRHVEVSAAAMAQAVQTQQIQQTGKGENRHGY